MRADEKSLAMKRQSAKTSVTAELLDQGKKQSEKETLIVEAAKKYLDDQHSDTKFPLTLSMYWKLEAGMEIRPEIESNAWYGWANQALAGVGHLARPMRQRIAREMCEASLRDLEDTEFLQDFEAVVAAGKEKKKEEKPAPPPWSYEKTELILSLVGNEDFTEEMISDINHVKLKVKEKAEEKADDQSADVMAKIKSYQISAPLTGQQEDAGLKREVIVVVQVAKNSEDKFFNAIKAKCKGFKVARLECFRSPHTQGKKLFEVLEAASSKDANKELIEETKKELKEGQRVLKELSKAPLDSPGQKNKKMFEKGVEEKQNLLKRLTESAAKEMLGDHQEDYITDLGITLLADAVASEVENDESEFHDLFDRFIRSQEDIVDNVKAEAHHHGLNLEKYVDRESIESVEKDIDSKWKGAVTLKDLYEYDSHAAHGLIMLAVGHGVSHLDEPEVKDWLLGKGLTEEEAKAHPIRIEAPYDGAYQFLVDLKAKDSEAESEAGLSDMPGMQELEPGVSESMLDVDADSKIKILKDFNGSEVPSYEEGMPAWNAWIDLSNVNDGKAGTIVPLKELAKINGLPGDFVSYYSNALSELAADGWITVAAVDADKILEMFNKEEGSKAILDHVYEAAKGELGVHNATALCNALRPLLHSKEDKSKPNPTVEQLKKVVDQFMSEKTKSIGEVAEAAAETTLFANPYGDANGFYFKDLAEYEAGIAKLAAVGAEEVEIDFIDGSSEDAMLFERLKVGPAELEKWFDEIEPMDDSEKAGLFHAFELKGDLDEAIKAAKDNEYSVSQNNIEDYAYDWLKESYPEIMDGPLGNYVDYKSYARDLELGGDMNEFNFGGETWVASNH